MIYILPVTLYAFGNRKSPRPPRPSIDIVVDGDLVKHPTSNRSINLKVCSGHYYRIDKGTPLPVAVIADGEDVGGNHSPTHHTIYPALDDFQNL